MRRTLLLISLAAASMAALAQERGTATVTAYREVPLFCVSANGRYVAGDMGAVVLYDVETGEQFIYEDTYYNTCTAKGVTNDGTIVGQLGSEESGISAPAAVLKKGAAEWELLTVPAGFNQQYEYTPQGVTPDGKYIIGFGYDLTVGIYAPLLWTLQGNGEYDVEVLPYPTEDIWGSQPQMVVCYGLSSDGTRAYGKVVDHTGYATLGIIYSKAADGSWSYQTVGEDWLINEGAENPGPQPTIEDYPNPAQLDAMILEWWEKADLYANLYNNPAYQIVVNQNSMSGNGNYFVMTTPDEARIYNTADGSFTPIANTIGMAATSVTNNGDVLLASPMASSYRYAYICPSSDYAEGPTGLDTWLGSNFDVSYDDDASMGLGTCCATPSGNTIAGFNMPQAEGMLYISAIVTIEGGSGVQNIELAKQPVISNGTLCIPQGDAKVEIYGIDGTRLASFNASTTADLTAYASGIVLVKVQAGKLTKTFKVAL